MINSLWTSKETTRILIVLKFRQKMMIIITCLSQVQISINNFNQRDRNQHCLLKMTEGGKILFQILRWLIILANYWTQKTYQVTKKVQFSSSIECQDIKDRMLLKYPQISYWCTINSKFSRFNNNTIWYYKRKRKILNRTNNLRNQRTIQTQHRVDNIKVFGEKANQTMI